MFTNARSYLPFFILIGAALLLALVGFISGLGSFNANRQAAAQATATPVALVGGLTPTPARPSSPALRPPQDGLTVALSGEMANGGYWRWEDIANLSGVYGTAGQLQTVTRGGATYSGVPFSYLLRYAQINAGTDRLLVSTRSGRQMLYALRSVDDFAGYVIAPAPDNTLALLAPAAQDFDTLAGLTMIQAARTNDVRNVQAPTIPARPDSLLLTGSIRRGGLWSWDDLSGLLGVYATAGQYRTVTAAGGTYSGVPVAYLFQYAEVTRDRVNTISLYTRSGAEQGSTSALLACETCIIARAGDGTLTLVQPGLTPEILTQLASIHIP